MGAWWIDEPLVLGSSNPSDEDLVRLRGQGFRVLVSLLQEKKQPPRYDVKVAAQTGWLRYSISVEDFHSPSLDQLRQFKSLLDGLSQGTKVLVHCEGGFGRTGTMAAATGSPGDSLRPRPSPASDRQGPGRLKLADRSRSCISTRRPYKPTQ
jgi:protein tyrosine phosphatase (PTP) superfamily phosphohydrolase (DUF442 family)